MNTMEERPGKAVAFTAWKHFTRMNLPDEYLTADEEVKLADRRDAGDIVARNELVERNVPLALDLAKAITGRYEHQAEDIVSFAMDGLIRAADGFDQSLGYRFATYATYAIKRRVFYRIGQEFPTIRVPSYLIDAVHSADLGRPSKDDAAKVNAECMAFARVAMAAPLRHAAEHLSTRFNRKPDTIDEFDRHDALRRALLRIPLRHRQVIADRHDFAGGVAIVDLAARFGVTRQRVQQIESDALARLRKIMANASPFDGGRDAI